MAKQEKKTEKKGGAPIGNQFWKLRSKHGRDKLFASPELLWDAACEYFQWCDNNPWHKMEALKGGERAGDLITIPTQRPYTLKGFCMFCDASEDWWKNFKKGENIHDFLPVITRIEETIYTNKYEGAVVGAFNANIIARDLGLADKREVDQKNREAEPETLDEIEKRLADLRAKTGRG